MRAHANFDVANCANLSPKYHIILQPGASRDPYLRKLCNVGNLHIMSNLHEIIDLGSLPIHVRPKRARSTVVFAPISTSSSRVGRSEARTQTRASQNNAAMESHASFHDATSADRNAFRHTTIFANHRIVPDVGAGTNQ